MAITVIAPGESDRGAGRIAADLLRDAAGVQVQQTSAGQGAVILRGLLGNQVLLLIDGIPLNNGTFRDGPGQYLATIDAETIERVEVLRGPASVLYGSDAQGGVVHLVTRPHPSGPNGLRLALRASGANDGYRARVSGQAGGSHVTAAFGATLTGAGDLVPGGGLPAQRPTGFEAVGLDARLEYRPTHRHTLSAALQRFAMRDVFRYDRYVTYRGPTPGADVEHRFDPQARELGYLRYRFRPSRPLLMGLEATASLGVQREGRVQQRRLSDGTADSLVERTRDDVYTPGLALVGSSLATLAGLPVALTWGTEFYRDELRSDGHVESVVSGTRTPLTRTGPSGPVPAGRFPDGGSAERLGVFLAGEADVAPWLRLSAGARWSHFRTEAEVGDAFGGSAAGRSADLTGQLGLVLRPAPAWRAALRVAEGFRAPNLYDLTNVGSVPGGIVLPNPQARPEHSLSIEASLRYVAQHASLEVTAYRQTLNDFIDRVPAAYRGDTLFRGERVFQGRNVGHATVLGAEAEAVARVRRFQARGTLAYTRGDQRVAGGVEEPMSKIPPLGGSAHLRWTSPTRIWLEYAFRWAAPQRRLGSRDLRDSRIAPGGTPGYAAHGVRGGATLTQQLSLTAGLENITDSLYREHASGVDQAGRHLWVGVSWLLDL